MVTYTFFDTIFAHADIHFGGLLIVGVDLCLVDHVRNAAISIQWTGPTCLAVAWFRLFYRPPYLRIVRFNYPIYVVHAAITDF